MLQWVIYNNFRLNEFIALNPYILKNISLYGLTIAILSTIAYNNTGILYTMYTRLGLINNVLNAYILRFGW